MKKLLKWVAFAVFGMILAIAVYVAAWFLTLTPHNLDQCYQQIMEYTLPDRAHATRMFYGCDDAAEDGMKRNSIKAYRFAGLYNADVRMDYTKARRYLYHAIRLGDNKSNYYLFNILIGIDNRNCKELTRLLTAFKPETPYMEKYKRSWMEGVREDVCHGPGAAP